ncbi:hypothetical protein BJV77DRAFT_964619 [Russula vinacea]|nr:hypothetical protein BJV77DRAFT_964619 [Russula vinacea]
MPSFSNISLVFLASWPLLLPLPLDLILCTLTTTSTPAHFLSPLQGFSSSSDPYEIARGFVTALLGDQLSGVNSFALRNDSYTNKANGVTHVFFRQMINGIEVADGDINVNVKDGAVISYGDSFYRGDAPSIFLINELITPGPHAERFWLESVYTDQVTISGFPPDDEDLDTRVAFTAGTANTSTPLMSSPRDPPNPFMVTATPHDAVAQEILNNHDQISENMTSSFGVHAIGSYVTVVETIDNVPDAVSPVQAKSVYIQLPDGDKTMLMQAWRFEVEMRDNWYEAVVSRQAPHHILSVLDWVSD